jgi:hypothetical protein
MPGSQPALRGAIGHVAAGVPVQPVPGDRLRRTRRAWLAALSGSVHAGGGGAPMSNLQRVDRVTGPLVVGQFYLVPTVRGKWIGQGFAHNTGRRSLALTANWPVIGPEHNDIEFFGFSTPHYHIDARFLPEGDKRIHLTLTYPLHGRRGIWTPTGDTEALPAPVWRRRKCIRSNTGLDPWGSGPITKMREHYAGRQCARNVGGWVCPHRQAPLGSVQPKDGVIICPLHGLHIDAATGVVLAP